MTAVYVHTQEELDKALAKPDDTYRVHKIVVCSHRDVWLKISDSHGKNVEVSGDAMLKVSGDTRVTAFGYAAVEVSGDTTVRAFENATVWACDRSIVRAWDCATVKACGRASVRAYDDATVMAWNRATVDAYGSATVKAGTCVPVHLHSKTVTHKGGVIIDMTTIDANDPETWCAMHLVEVDEDRQAHLYKALDADLNAGHNCRLTQYPIGQVVDDTANWVDDNKYGNGLHASPTPWLAKAYYKEASRFVEVCCPVEELRPISSSKAKAPRFRVLREVTLDGSPIGGGTR